MTLEQARALYSAGRLPDARRRLEALLARTPEDAAAHFLLGLVEIGEGAAGAGLARIEQRAGAVRPPATVCQHFAELRFAGREFGRAAAWLQRALAQDPTLAPAWIQLGNALRMLGRPAEAEEAFRRGIAIAPALEEAYVGLAFLQRELARPADAAATMAELARTCADRPEALEKALGFLEDLDQLELAGEVADRLAGLAAGDARLQSRLGRLYSKLGRFEPAAECFRRAIALDARSGAAYLGLSVARRFSSPADPDAELIRKALARGGLDDGSLACIHFALGKILDDCGEYAAAFEQFHAGNELVRRARPFDVENYLRRTRRVREAFPPGPRERLPTLAPHRSVPVFVVGMMRSGTTLVERILDRHPQVHGAGEQDVVETVASALGLSVNGAAPPPPGPPALDAARLREMARECLRGLEAQAGGAAFVVDKNPGNFAYLGVLALLFPQAKFVHCARDPLDTCLSVYFQHFAREEQAWTYDLAAIAEVYADYRRTMAHWRSVLPGRIFEVDYQALVTDPAATTRALLDFLGLPFDPACLEPHRNARGVGTASVWQARQPVYTGSVGRWRHYAGQLGPLRERLRAAGVPLDDAEDAAQQRP
jgi:tetratricopeptide (TPR) repeat protein